MESTTSNLECDKQTPEATGLTLSKPAAERRQKAANHFETRQLCSKRSKYYEYPTILFVKWISVMNGLKVCVLDYQGIL